MSSNVPVAQATSDEAVLPERVQEALGQLVGAAKEGLLALSVGVGLGVLSELMEEEVDDVVGPKGKHNPERTAVRHGHEDGEVTLGGRRVEVAAAAGADRGWRVRGARLRPMSTSLIVIRSARVVLERMLAGVSTRRYRRTQEPVGEEVETRARSTSKSAVSRTFVERTREALGELMSRQLADLRLAVMMLDGLELKGRMMIVALGITTEGVKIPLGLWEGIDGERDRRDRAAVRPGRARPGSRAGDAVRDRRIQGAAQGRALGVRRGARPALPVAQGAQRAAASPRARPPADQGPDAPGVAGDRLPARARAAHTARRRARAHPPRRRRLAARRDGGDADRDPARDPRQAPPHAGVDQPVRVDDRHRPHHPAQRQALVLRRDGPAVDRRRDARSREDSSARSSATPTSRASRSRSNDDSTFTSPTPPRPRRPRSQSLCNDHTGTAVTEVPRRPGQPHRWWPVEHVDPPLARRAGGVDPVDDRERSGQARPPARRRAENHPDPAWAPSTGNRLRRAIAGKGDTYRTPSFGRRGTRTPLFSARELRRFCSAPLSRQQAAPDAPFT